jgi:hypothetical protein
MYYYHLGQQRQGAAAGGGDTQHLRAMMQSGLLEELWGRPVISCLRILPMKSRNHFNFILLTHSGSSFPLSCCE